MEDNISNLKQGSSLQGGKYVIKEALGSGGGTEDDTILSVSDDTGKINGHEYVDLGLSVKWATCNVGASSPTEYGNYYAWGETTTKSEYTKKNSKTCGISMGDISGNSSYDAARTNWGGSWRLPTKAECQELLDNCKSEWTTVSGVRGRRFTSKKNGRSIFLPAAGYHEPKFFSPAGATGRRCTSLARTVSTGALRLTRAIRTALTNSTSIVAVAARAGATAATVRACAPSQNNRSRESRQKR